jgi:hypothetical protein
MASVLTFYDTCKSASDKARRVVKIYCALKDIYISKTEEEVMAYLITYGINENTKKDFLIGPDKLVKTSDSLSTMLNKLKRIGLLVKQSNGYELPDLLKNCNPQQKLGMQISLG